MTPNGPAIKLVSVTRRRRRAGHGHVARETVTAQGGYGAFFAAQAGGS